jgi:hypothetical protein
MNGKKFSFLIVTNKEEYYNECVYYIGNLKVPEGYVVECVPVHQASGMASGYNAAMQVTDAKYKIFIQQDVFILNRHFLQDLLTVFESDPRIGMVGMTGIEKLPKDMLLWGAPRVGALYNTQTGKADYEEYSYNIEDGMTDVECVDGLLIATQTDLKWRADLFDGWDLYDAAQSCEFRRKGYRLVVPVQKLPWVFYDRPIVGVWNYNKYRKIFLQEYQKELED